MTRVGLSDPVSRDFEWMIGQLFMRDDLMTFGRCRNLLYELRWDLIRCSIVVRNIIVIFTHIVGYVGILMLFRASRNTGLFACIRTFHVVSIAILTDGVTWSNSGIGISIVVLLIVWRS